MQAKTRPRTVLALAVIGVLAAAIGASLSLFALPPSLPASAPGKAFSGARALGHLERLSPGPHPVYSASKHAVRDGISDYLRSLGLEPQVQGGAVLAPGKASGGEVSNVVARIPGGGEKLGPILLVSHYDSVPFGPGASDNASGCAVLLEVARALRWDRLQGRLPPRDLILLWTDGEEFGQLGAEAYLASLGELPALVINVDTARDMPLFMLGESPRNGGLLRAFQSSGAGFRGFSWISAAAGGLAVDSDYSPFRRAGIPGTNLGSLSRFPEYHTALDTVAAASPQALQQAGNQLLSLARALAESREATFDGEASAYFSLLPGWTVVFPLRILAYLVGFAWALTALALALAFGRRGLTLRSLARGLGLSLLFLVGALGIGFALQSLLSLGRPEYKLPRYSVHLPLDWILALVMVAGALAWILGILWCFRKKEGLLQGLTEAFLLLLCLASLGLSLALPQAAFLALVPAVGLALGLGVQALLPRLEGLPVLVLGGLATWLLYLPMGILVFLGLGLPGLPWLSALTALMVLALAPALDLPRAHSGPGFLGAGILALGTMAAGLALVGFSPACPLPTYLGYVYNADSGKAGAFVLGGARTPWQRAAKAALQGAPGPSFQLASVLPYAPIIPAEGFPAPVLALEPPGASLVEAVPEGDRWRYVVRITRPEAGGILVGLPDSLGLEALEVGGRSYPATPFLVPAAKAYDGQGRYQWTHYATQSTFLVAFVVRAGPQGSRPGLTLTLASLADSLPPGLGVPPLPPGTLPQNDATVVVRTVRL